MAFAAERALDFPRASITLVPLRGVGEVYERWFLGARAPELQCLEEERRATGCSIRHPRNQFSADAEEDGKTCVFSLMTKKTPGR